MTSCEACFWRHPDTCRTCQAEETRIIFKGKAKDMTPEEIAKAWNYGHKVELVETNDFGRN